MVEKKHKAAQKSERLIICLLSGASELRLVVVFSAKSSECKTEEGREGGRKRDLEKLTALCLRDILLIIVVN